MDGWGVCARVLTLTSHAACICQAIGGLLRGCDCAHTVGRVGGALVAGGEGRGEEGERGWMGNGGARLLTLF